MSCYGERVSQDIYHNCCNANELCEFDGDMTKLFTVPIYVQQVFDAVRFNLQGMKTFNNQNFHHVSRPVTGLSVLSISGVNDISTLRMWRIPEI